jgi:DNA mismatch repair protein MutH
MERAEAIIRLQNLVGVDLHSLAAKYEVTVIAQNGKTNKGWAGHVLERYLGLPINSAQSPNFGSWELKSIPLRRLPDGRLAFKETMAVTMIDPYHVLHTDFADSHLLAKLRKAVCVARIVGPTASSPTFLHAVVPMELSPEIYQAVRADYDLVRECLRDPKRGFATLTGRMGTYIQPRTKGRGHGSTSRAFYARKNFLALFIPLAVNP